jgi:hypothetical protein
MSDDTAETQKKPEKPEEKVSPSKTFLQALAKDPKNVVAIIMAITALVTAITSLVKAFDKSVEKQSYETLVTYIKQLQENQSILEGNLKTGLAAPLASAGAPGIATVQKVEATPAPSVSVAIRVATPPAETARPVAMSAPSTIVSAAPPMVEPPKPVAKKAGVRLTPPIRLETPKSWDQVVQKAAE